MEDDVAPKEKRRIEGVIHKVQYAKYVSVHIPSSPPLPHLPTFPLSSLRLPNPSPSPSPTPLFPPAPPTLSPQPAAHPSLPRSPLLLFLACHPLSPVTLLPPPAS